MTTPTTESAERVAFEAWTKATNGCVARLKGTDQYIGTSEQAAWKAWQARAAQPPVAVPTFLMPDDLAALKRFYECCEDCDADGHDVAKNRMARLREIGVVESKWFGHHQVTAFGDYVLSIECGGDIVLPLKTWAEREQDARGAHIADQQPGNAT